MEKRPPAMVRKFLQAEGRALQFDPNIPAYDAFRKEPYFFYGTLMDPSTLAKILKLRDPPALVPRTRWISHCRTKLMICSTGFCIFDPFSSHVHPHKSFLSFPARYAAATTIYILT
jgi:hypothetical protein